MQINCLACYLVHINIKCTIDHSKCRISPEDGGLLFNRFHICSRVELFATPWTVVHQVLLSMGFPRKEYWNAYHSLLQGIFMTKGSNPGLLTAARFFYRLSHHLQVLWEVFLTQALNSVFFLPFLVSETPVCPQPMALWLCPYCSSNSKHSATVDDVPDTDKDSLCTNLLTVYPFYRG